MPFMNFFEFLLSKDQICQRRILWNAARLDCELHDAALCVRVYRFGDVCMFHVVAGCSGSILIVHSPDVLNSRQIQLYVDKEPPFFLALSFFLRLIIS